MIIRLDGGTAEKRQAAKQELASLTEGWGHELTNESTAIQAPATEQDRHDDRVIDPVSLTALIVSLPAAALAVHDLADRVRKRRRAHELIDHARHLAEQQVIVWLISQDRQIEISSMDPDHLLELMTDNDPSPDRTHVGGPR